jgi:hypothetical protein
MENAEIAANTPPESAAGASPKPYIAVVFFHGIGHQRNYESCAQLVDAINEFVYTEHSSANPQFELDRLDTRTRREQLGDPKHGEEIVCIQADYGRTRVRFYEAYWAPATLLGTTARSVFLWLMRQIARPVSVLFSPWRSYARLRRAELIRMDRRLERNEAEQGEKNRITTDTRTLVDLYQRFVMRRGPQRGRFGQFVRFIKRERGRDPDQLKRLLNLARRWRWLHVRTELARVMTLSAIGVSIVACLALLLIASLALLDVATGWIKSVEALARLDFGDKVAPNLGNAVAVMAAVIGAFGISKFLRDFVGDVQQFVSYEEREPLHERRKKVLCMADKTLRHVLNDPNCERVVIAAHSLGTAVAVDAVLGLRGANEASNPQANDGQIMKGPIPLHKIHHLVTCGSPIDKVNYFFASFRSASRSYEAMIDDLRGDIGSVPFSKSGKQPHIHWINFWDRGDPISGAIETVTASIIRHQRVDNYQVASYLWPDPTASHAAYFNHREVIKVLFGIAFRNEFSFANPDRDERGRPIWRWQGPGAGSVAQIALLSAIPVTAALLIWTSLALWIPGLGPAPLVPFGISVAVLILGGFVQRKFRLHGAAINKPRDRSQIQVPLERSQARDIT